MVAAALGWPPSLLSERKASGSQRPKADGSENAVSLLIGAMPASYTYYKFFSEVASKLKAVNIIGCAWAFVNDHDARLNSCKNFREKVCRPQKN